MTLRMSHSAPLQIRIGRGVGTGTRRSCPNPGGRFSEIAALRQLPARAAAAAAAAVARRLALNPRLAPGLYRITVRAELDDARLSRPLPRYLRVLG